MDCISGFGTKFAAPIWVSAIGATALLGSAISASAASGADVTVSVSSLRNVKGQLMVCLTKNPKAFPDCSKDASTLRRLVPAANGGSIVFSNVPAGTYAVAVVHDENKNNKMDLRIFIPKEGFAFSRNPKIFAGPPKFKSASFAVGSSSVSQSVTMKYMF